MDADLVLEGGGVKGIGLVGAFSTLVDHDYTFHRIAGTSAGAIVGALIAAGMPPEDLKRMMRTVDYGQFQDEGFIDHLGMVGKGISILFEKGIYEGRYLVEWLDGILMRPRRAHVRRSPHRGPQLLAAAGRAYKLVIMTSDVTRGRLVRLPWDYPRYGLEADEQSVADAVRASMSIPFFYEPLRFYGRDERANACGRSWWTAACSRTSPSTCSTERTGSRRGGPRSGSSSRAKPTAPVLQRFEVSGAVGLARAMVGTMTNFHDQMHIDDPSVLARTMFVDTGRVKATDFDIDEPTQDMLFTNGRAAPAKFLKWWDFDAYVREFRSGDTIDLTAHESSVDAG